MWPFTGSGTWLDHQCRKPWFIESRRIGDRWKCECGRVWVVAAMTRYLISGEAVRRWRLLEDQEKGFGRP